MGWRDSVAIKARQMGKTSGDFKKGSQRKASTTCLYLSVAGAVWYFVGWPWALIPAALAALSACQTVSATMVALRLEKAEQASQSR
jgi:hypothetical protein